MGRVFALLLAAVLLVPAAVPASAQAAEVRPSIQPQIDGNDAVRSAQRVEVSGSAPSGAIQSAALVALSVDGQEIARERVPSGDLNKPGVSGATNDFIRNDNGTLSGQLTLGCEFADPEPPPGDDTAQPCSEPGVRRVALDVTINGVTGRSNLVRVDYIRPGLDGFAVVSPDTIRVTFTEAVRNPQGDSGTDFTVGEPSRTVVAVTQPDGRDCIDRPGDDPGAPKRGCTRLLRLDQPLDEDDTPVVEYTNTGGVVPQRTGYEDFASNRFLALEIPREEAIDRIRPAVPDIESIAGRSAGTGPVDGNDATPQVVVDNVEQRHEVTLTVKDSGGQTVAKVTQTVPQDAMQVTFELGALPSDSDYTLSAFAVDPAGNRSDDRNLEGPGRADGDPTALYRLDTVAPQVVAATQTGAREVRVTVTEAIIPDEDRGDWRVGDQAATATGSGDTRTLTVTNPVPQNSAVSWAPDASGTYTDRAGNELQPVNDVPVLPLPPLNAPQVNVPASETYTKASRATISGTAPNQPNLVVDLFDRGAEAPRATTQVRDGAFSFDQELASDRRFEFAVRARDTRTGATSGRVRVPDIVRDTVAPIVDVTAPAQAPLNPTNPDRRQRFGVGDAVTIQWRASDPAATDSERRDHGAAVNIDIVFGDGTRRAIARNLTYQAGQKQTFTHTLIAKDLAGQGSREARFDVTVVDLATNAGTDASAPILIIGDLVGYKPVLTEAGNVEARFRVPLAGNTSAAEWFVDETPDGNPTDDVPVQMAIKTERNGATVVELTIVQVRDPNAILEVRFQPLAVNPTPLRGPNGTLLSTAPRLVVDSIVPSVTLATKSPDRPVDAKAVELRGRTEASSRPHTISVFRTGTGGKPKGAPVAQKRADADGDYAVRVGLTPNAVNRFVVQATDRSGNASRTVPRPPFTVVEDSIDPVVKVLAPASGGFVAAEQTIRWKTVDAHRGFARIDYRDESGRWQPIDRRTPDDGRYVWEVPDDLHNDVIAVRVTAVDRAGNRGAGISNGLRVDTVAPSLRRARATGAQVVELTFSENVTVAGRPDLEVDGGGEVARVKGSGRTYVFILDAALASTRPNVGIERGTVRDRAGNPVRATTVRAKRAFAFAVRRLDAERTRRDNVRLTWADGRNETRHLRGYRVYRDGRFVAQVGPEQRRFIDRDAKSQRHQYV
ncbi:MAG: hypothetical protein M3O86_04420, partial [Actinomycetota bacterium]|nr:hypothetical protein [Actinomycetota bacterium]